MSGEGGGGDGEGGGGDGDGGGGEGGGSLGEGMGPATLAAVCGALGVLSPAGGLDVLAPPVGQRTRAVRLAIDDELERLHLRADAPRLPLAALPSSASSSHTLPPKLLLNLEALLGGDAPSLNALQAGSFDALAGGRDAILHAHTGSGKTLATLLPLLCQLQAEVKQPQLLLLCPSRELAHQTARVATTLCEGSGLSALALVGGANVNRQLEAYKKRKPQVIVGTAGRIAELALDSKKVSLRRVRHVVLDEVDEALVPPHLEDTMRIVQALRARAADGGDPSLWKRLQLVFASATADGPTVRRTAIQLMERPLLMRLEGADVGKADEGGGGGVAAGGLLPATIAHGICVVPRHKQVEELARLSRVEPPVSALVFVNSPHRARVVSELLWTRHGIDAPALRGTQEREERVAVIRGLVERRLRLVIATEMGARGLDFPALTHVVNLEMPTDERHYVHRAGRCGRAGAEGEVLSLVPPSDRSVAEKLASRLGLPLVPMRIHAGVLERDPASRVRLARGERWRLSDDTGGARPPAARVRKTVDARRKARPQSRAASADKEGRGGARAPRPPPRSAEA